MRTFKATVSWLLHLLGILHLVSWWQRSVAGQRLLILSFHCIWDRREPGSAYFRPGMRIEFEQFAAVLRVLCRHYDVVPLDEAVPAPATGRTRAVVTFDDGYRSVYDYGFPLMYEAGVPATIFLPTDYIGTSKLLWWDEVAELISRGGQAVDAVLGEPASPAAACAAVDDLKFLPGAERDAWISRLRVAAGKPRLESPLMGWAEVREMYSAGFDFENHTASHRYLPDLDVAELRADLQRAHSTIRRQVGRAPRHFAYPDGRPHPEAGAILAAAGYRSGVSTLRRANTARTHPFFLRRVEASQDFRGPTGRPSESLIWAELLGVWDVLLWRRRRAPGGFTTSKEPRRARPSHAVPRA